MQKLKFFTLAIIAMLSVNFAWGDDYSIDFSTKGYSNQQVVSSATITTGLTVSLTKGSGSNDPKYYTTGTAVRIYAKGSFTITSTIGNITGVTLTFSSGEDSNTITSNVGTWSSPSWSGSATSVTFSIGGSSGHRRIKAISVTVASTASPVTSLYLSEAGTLSENLKGSYKVGDSYTLPSSTEADCGDKVLVGWSTVAIPNPSVKPTSNYYDKGAQVTLAANNTFYAVFADAEEGTPTETKSQTLQYDTWSYSGSTTDKSSYRLFHSGSYIESAAFDLSTLSKVIVYGGTFGGSSYNSLTIGDGTNTWKSVTVSGSSQTGTNTYTDGTALSGTKKLRVTSNSGTATGTGVRISKVEIFTKAPAITYSNYTTTCATCTAISPTLSYTATATVGQVLNPTLDKKGSSGAVTYSIKSGSSYASINTTTGALTCSAAGTVTVQATIAAAGDYCEGTATSNTITISAPSYTVTAQSNNTELGTVSGTTSITASPKECVGYANPAYTVAPAGKATVAQSGNTFTVSNVTDNVTVTINFAELAKDTYVDHLHNNATIEECGSYTAPSLDDAAKATTGDCDVVHYHFAGWVIGTISTGTPGVPSGMITAGTAMNANGKEYIAVWAKEQ